MKRLSIISVPVVLLLLGSCAHPNRNSADQHQINSTNMESNTKESVKGEIPKVVTIVDVRTPEEFAEGNIAGSINVPLDLLEDSLDSLKEFENIVVVCRSGNRSAQAKQILNKNGFTNITDGKAWDTYNK